MTTNTVQETILRIQEEAKRKIELARFSKSKLVSKNKTTKLIVPAAVEPTAQHVADTLREHLSTAIAQALSTKAARNYIGDVTESLQNIATEVITKNRSDQEFGGTPKDNKNKVIIYPNNCKLLVQGEQGHGCMIIEEPPQYRTILGERQGSKITTYRIPMPYVVYIIGFYSRNNLYYVNGYGLGFGKQPIDSIENELFEPCMPHTSGNRHICQPLMGVGHESVKKLGEYVVQTFWNTSFHYTFEDACCVFNVGNKRISSFRDWQKIENPLDIIKADFRRGDTVKSLLSQMGNVKESRNFNFDRKIQLVVNNVINNVSETFSADELSNVIRTTAEEIVNVALQNAIGNSGLQQPKTVV